MIITSKNDSLTFDYELDLTGYLDGIGQVDFDEMDILKITLWKVQRFPHINVNVLENLNKLKDVKDIDADKERISAVLKDFLSNDCKGVRLPMASTYLRFRNPNVFQILDRRVWHWVYQNDEDEKKREYTESIIVNEQIEKYLKYLRDLRKLAKKDGVRFCDADRYYYLKDKKEGHLIGKKQSK